ncbi:MAG: alpha/beta hydrolase, partial [Pseudomonadales bacterium]|nr:alpha/beta hydrolase [Pseudomonadales bacterium]
RTITEIGDFNYLMVNYRGYGESTGEPSESALKADALVVLDRASEQFDFDIDNVIVMGRSLGTGVAMHVAANRPVKALILVSPFDSLRAVASTHYPIFPVGPLLRHPFRSIDYVDDTMMPTLILKAANDEIVPHQHTNNLIAHWQGPLWTFTLPGTTHNRVVTDEYYDHIREFIRTVISGGVSLAPKR